MKSQVFDPNSSLTPLFFLRIITSYIKSCDSRGQHQGYLLAILSSQQQWTGRRNKYLPDNRDVRCHNQYWHNASNIPESHFSNTIRTTALTTEISASSSAIETMVPTDYPVEQNPIYDSFEPTRVFDLSMRSDTESYIFVYNPLETIWDGSVAKSPQFITVFLLIQQIPRWKNSARISPFPK